MVVDIFYKQFLFKIAACLLIEVIDLGYTHL